MDPKCSIYFAYVLAVKVINHGYLAKKINKSIKLCFGPLHFFSIFKGFIDVKVV